MIVQKKDLTGSYEINKIISKENKERNTWKWIILLGCFLLQMLPTCVALNLSNVFAASDWAVWSAGNNNVIGLTFTMGAIGAAMVGPFIANAFSKKINLRMFYSLGIILAMIGFSGSSLVSIIIKTNGGVKTALPNLGSVSAILWISNIITQIGVTIFSTIGINNLISKWWPTDKRGFALGLAAAGGAFGNIWMQQIVGWLSGIFGNELVDKTETIDGVEKIVKSYDWSGNQYATYLIMATIGLVGGLLVVMFVCRKPLPPVDILDATVDNNNTNVKRQVLEVSPLVTQKYPPYWILCIGYLILQMGTLHASQRGLFIQFALSSSHPDFSNPKNILALGGTLFGVSCLVGNSCGGIINDKLGPAKSIFLAGMTQCAAIFCLMYSVKTPELVYVYFILAGLSVYVYTSTPAFVTGRLYGPGQSNAHMSILGIFTALGFAIVNSIAGSLTGALNSSNTHVLLGQAVQGNWLAWSIFGIVCMGLGTIIVSLCCVIITDKGIEGLLDYSPTKYSRLILYKHGISIRFNALRIQISGKDYRVNNKERINKIKVHEQKQHYHGSINEYHKMLEEQLKDLKLSKQELNLLNAVLYFDLIEHEKLIDYVKNDDIKKEVQTLINKDLIRETKLGVLGTVYEITPSLTEKLQAQIDLLNQKYPNIIKEHHALDSKLDKISNKLEIKLNKLNQKLEETKNQTIDETKQQVYTNKSKILVSKYEQKREEIFNKIKSNPNIDEWKQYKLDYEITKKIVDAKALEHKLELDKQNKINNLMKKIGSSQYVSDFHKKEQIHGNYLLLDYYNDIYRVYDELINKKINFKLNQKQALLQAKTNNYSSKLDKVVSKKEKLDNEFEQLSKIHE